MVLVHDRAIIVAEEDRISNLPDEIIHGILSFVGMKDAVRTSKISRRWRHLWKTMPHLNIDTNEFHDLLRFAKFIKHALSHRNNSALVSSVNLTFRRSPTQFAVKSIVKYALSHDVKQLTMRCNDYTGQRLEFPQFLFSSHTLKILTLNGMDAMHSIRSCFVPESGWDFPSLETLNLTEIHITGVTDKSVNPFSKCVNLKNLTLDRLQMDRKWIFIIDAPQLSNLAITNAIRFPEVIHVVAPQLQNLTASLTSSGFPYSKLQLLTKGFNSLEKVELSAQSSLYGKTWVTLLLDMLHKVCSATVLILDKNIIEAISSHLDELSHEPCPFNNLKCLKVHGVSCYPTRAKNYLVENSPSATFIMDSPEVSQKRSRWPPPQKRSSWPQKRSRWPVPDDGMANKVAKLEAENKQAEITDEEKRTLKAKVPNQGEVIETQLGYLTDTAPTRAPSPSSVNDGDNFVDETRYEQVVGNLEDDCEEVEIVEPISKETWQLKRKQATQKKFEKEGNEDRAIIVAEEDTILTEEDRLSNLSDEIIHRILSFVDMKDAIRTSKISRRWRHIWTTIPYLNLDTSEFRYLPQFANFVKHALSHRNNNASVSSVNLTLTGAPTNFAVKNIIKYAFSHNVKQLTMRCCAEKSLFHEFPKCLFSSLTLKILTLTGNPSSYTGMHFETVSGWDFPSLETLNLTNISFKPNKILSPFSKCVNLKNLTLDKFCMSHVGIFIIYAPQLSNLTITRPFRLPKLINVVAPQLQNLTASLTEDSVPYPMLQLLTEGFNSLEKVELSSYQKIDVPLLLHMFHEFCSATVLILDKHVIESISSCLDKFSLERCPFNNLKCLKVHGVSCYPTQAKNYLLENSPSAIFIMDSPQVPQNRARKPVPNDGMANKVAKLVAENKQAETIDKQKRTLKAKIPTLVEVSELRTKIQMLENTKWQLVKLMPHIIKGKMAELKRQVESGNPDYNDISLMGSQFKSLLPLIPKCARVAMVAHFSTRYIKMKRLSHTYINARQWAKIETQLGNLTDSERVYSNSIQIQSDILSTDIAPTPSSANGGDTFVDKTRCEQADGDLEDDSGEVETVELVSKERGQLKRKRATQEKAKKEGKELSECWQYFEKVYKNELDGVKKYGKCKHCKKLIKADPIKNGTLCLKEHFNSCEVNPEVRASKQSNLAFTKDTTSGEGGSSVNVWRHDELAIKEALLDFFICEEVPLKLVEHWAFVRLVNQLNGKVKLPSRHKLSKDIAKYYIEERSKLFVYLSDPKTTIHLTIDTWTSSCEKVNYMVVTAHFIDENWVMHKRIINFRPIESHMGDDIGFELLRCINGWGIQNVMTITLDNAFSNDKAIEYLLQKLPNLYDKGKHFHVRCMARIMNLIVKDGLCNQRYHVECVQKAIRYIRHSTQRITKFKESMKIEKLESEKFLYLDCPTSWNSTYEMLKIAVGLQKVFSRYESADPCYERDLVRIPDRDDFNASEKLVQFLEKFKDKTEAVLETSKPLSHLFLREVLDVDNHLRVWETDIDFCNMVRQMRERFDKYWGGFDKLNDYFYFAVILDPTMKLVFVRHCFRVMITNAITKENPMSKTFIEKMAGVLVGDVENRLGKLFETYQARFDIAGSGSQEARNEENALSLGKNDFFVNYLHVEGRTTVALETELIRYLHEPEVNFEPGFDILKWWSLNGNRFPVVARMARDILAIQISSVASESAFSMGGRMLDPYRTRLSTNIVEALICTQDWVRKSSNSIYMDQVEDILNDDDVAIEIEEAINNRKDKGKEQMLVEE